MKKIFYFSLFLLASFTSAQIVEIPDTSFKNALIELGVDTNNDGEIQLTEAYATVQDLNLNNKNISDLTGIKSFVNVKKLFCGPNNLVSVDLSGMTNLEHVYLGRNYLNNVNLSGVTKIQYLYVPDNQISSINLSGLIYLKYLDLGGNNFSSLQISDLPSLEGFSFGDNKVPANITFNSLPNINRLYLDGSKLTEINLHGLQTLKILNCSDNQLNSLSFQDGFLQNLQFLSVRNNPIQFICKDSYDILPAEQWVPQLTDNCILSAGEIVKKKISVYPNPSKEYLNLNLPVRELQIINLDGKVIVEKRDNKELRLNISKLPEGLYLLQTELGSTKFIKQ